jgi:hypothetical protein
MREQWFGGGQGLAYRNRLTSQAAITADVPTVPEWYDTPSTN